MTTPTDEQRRIDILQATYPGWRIIRLGPVWWATLRRPPAPDQQAAGVVHQLARVTAVDLAAALDQQSQLLDRWRGRW